MKTRVIVSMLGGIVASGSIAISGASAQDLNFPPQADPPGGYPERPITVISPFGPGGGSDRVARAMASELSEITGGDFQVVNQPGAGGLEALPEFFVAQPDGYTILQHTESPITAFAAGRISQRPGEDLKPICVTQVAFSMFFIAGDNENYQDWEEMVAYFEETGDPVRVATSSGTGSHEHVSVVQTENASGLDFEIIPFGDPGERYSAVLGGHADLLFDQPGHLMQYVEQGELIPAMQLLRERPDDPVLSEVPSITDIGYDFEPTFKIRGFYFHQDVPEDIQAYMQWACGEAYQTESYQAFNEETFTHLVRSYYGPDDAVDLIDTMITTFQDMYEEIGIGN